MELRWPLEAFPGRQATCRAVFGTWGSDLTPIARSLQTWDRRVRPRLGLRHGTPLASRGVPGETGHLSSGIWNLGVRSDSDRKVPADLGQESQASSWVEAWNSACLSRCSRGDRPLVERYLELGGPI